MACTKYSIADQIMLRLRGGRPDAAKSIDIRDIIIAVGQTANALMKAEYFTTLSSGETIPDGAIIATYDDIPVYAYRSVSRADLPAMPISLPKNMGVWEIISGDGISCVFIPLQAGIWHLVQTDGLISDLGGQIGYEVYGKNVEFKSDLSKKNITKVSMKLIVNDVTTLTEYEPLPIPADQETQIIEILFKQFMGTPPADTDTDLVTDKQKG